MRAFLAILSLILFFSIPQSSYGNELPCDKEKENSKSTEVKNESATIPSETEPKDKQTSEVAEKTVENDTTYSSLSKFNFIFYFIYKYKYEEKFGSEGIEEIEKLTSE